MTKPFKTSYSDANLKSPYWRMVRLSEDGQRFVSIVDSSVAGTAGGEAMQYKPSIVMELPSLQDASKKNPCAEIRMKWMKMIEQPQNHTNAYDH
jgi:hypothetical protein